HEAARFAIDLWLRTEAAAKGFTIGQIWRPATATSGARATLREAVQQVALALVESLQAHDMFWKAATRVIALPTWGTEPTEAPDAPTWDYEALAQQARHDVGEITPLLDGVLEASLVARLVEQTACLESRLDDDLWVRIVYAFAASTRRGSTG